MSDYKSRKDQINREFYGRIRRAFQKEGLVPPATIVAIIKECLKHAATVGAFEERHRTLEYLGGFDTTDSRITKRFIVEKSVLDVLGYSA